MNARKSNKAKFLLMIVTLFMVFGNGVAYAQADAEEEDPCPKNIFDGGSLFNYIPGVCTFKRVKETVEDLDVRRVMQDGFTEMTTGIPMHAAYGRSMDQMHYCIGTELGAEIPAALIEAEGNEDCSDLTYDPLLVLMGVPTEPPTSSRMAGSFAGIATRMIDITYSEPPPVNLAYYAKHVARKVPVLGSTAYAQGAPTSPTLQAVLEIWELSRNTAYGLMAVFMLAIGVMIMMRKQIDPKTAVTVQNALPRIVIATVLITFSYAIGAFALTMIPGLVAASLEPLFLAYQESFATFGPMMVVAVVIWMLLGSIGTLGISWLLGIIALLVLIFMFLWVIVKALLAYFKIIIQIIIAPIIFAWGAIPGNEEVTKDWFKDLAINVIVVPGMMFFIGVALLIAWKLMIIPFQASGAAGGVTQAGIVDLGVFVTGFTGDGVMAGFQVPLMMMMILFFAGKLPKKLEEAIKGKSK